MTGTDKKKICGEWSPKGKGERNQGEIPPVIRYRNDLNSSSQKNKGERSEDTNFYFQILHGKDSVFTFFQP